MFQVDIPS